LEAYSGVDRDIPLKLQSTQDWQKHKAHVWDVIAELVALTVKPKPKNPFAIDFALLESIPLVQSTLCSGALLNTMHEIASSGLSPFDLLLLQDIQKLSEIHFMGLGAIATAIREDAQAEQVDDE